MSYLDMLLNRSVEKVLSQTGTSDEKGKKRTLLEEIIFNKAKKSKKNKKDKKGSSEDIEEVDFSEKNLKDETNSENEMDVEKNYIVPKKKKKKRDREKNEIDTNSAETESNSPRKKKRKKDKEMPSNDCSEEAKDTEQIDKNTFGDTISGTPSTSRHNSVISDIYCPPNPEIITGELYNVVMYILKKNINVSMVNTVWTRNTLPSEFQDREKNGETWCQIW